MSFSTGSSSQQSEINVTPLIDVLLVLLIIFMVIVPMKPSGLKALVPQPSKSSAPSEPAPRTIVLEVRGHGGSEATYALNQQPIARAALTGRLAEIYASRQDRVLFLKGDPELTFSTVADAISAAHKASIYDIAVITPKVTQGS